MSRKSQRIQIDIETRARLAAVEKAQAEIRDLTGQIAKTTRESANLRAAGGSLSGAFRMGGAIAGFTALLGVATRLTSQLPALTREVIAGGDAIAKKSELYGVSTSMLQEFRFAAQQTGVETHTADMALQRFTRRFGEAAEGTGELLPILRQYNIAVKDSEGNTRAVEDVMSDLADVIAATPSRAERLRIAFKAFDSEGAALVNTLRGGSEGLAELRAQAQEAGVVLGADTVEAFEQAQSAMDQFTASAKARFAEVVVSIVQAVDAITDFSGKLAARQADIAAIQSLTGESFSRRRQENELEYAARIARAVERTGNQRIEDEKAALALLEDRALLEQAFTQLGGQTVRTPGPRALTSMQLDGQRVDDLSQNEAVRTRALAIARQQVAAKKETAAAEIETKTAAQETAQASTRAAQADEHRAELARELAEFQKRQLEAARLLPLLKADLISEQQQLDTLLSAQELDEKAIEDKKKTILKLTRETVALEKELTGEVENQAEKIAALAELQGLAPIGGGRFAAQNLSRFDQSRAAVQGQESLAFDPASGGFTGTGETTGGLGDPQAHFQTIGEGALAAVYEYQAAIGTLGDQINRAFTDIFTSIEQGISTSITGLINGTMTWGQALQNIGQTIVQSVINSFAQMAAQWITNQILMMTVGKSLQAANLAANAPLALAQTALWTPAAIAASIATFGAAAITGTALAKASIAAGALPGFADGGLISGPGGPREDAILARLSSGEFVVNAAATAQHRPLLEAINNNHPLPRYADGGSVGPSGSTTTQPAQIYIVDTLEAARDLYADIPGPAQIREIARSEIYRRSRS